MQLFWARFTGGGHYGAMGGGMSISASGLQAASLQFSAAASNIVNMNTDGAVPSTPPSQPVNQSSSNVYQPVTVSQSATADGGVTASTQPSLPAYLLAYSPQAPYANMQGMVATPNVDIATELVHVREAANSFRANLLALKVASRMTDTLLDTVA
jgi:flagellar basal-body rod protein FlgC